MNEDALSESRALRAIAALVREDLAKIRGLHVLHVKSSRLSSAQLALYSDRGTARAATDVGRPASGLIAR